MKPTFFSSLAILLLIAYLSAPLSYSAQPSTTDISLAVEKLGSRNPEEAPISSSLGWGVLEIENESIYFYARNNGEFRSFYAYSPERNIGAAIITNGANDLSFLSEIFTPFVGDIRPASVW